MKAISSSKSPKNPFKGTIYFERAQKNLGSSITLTGNSIEEVKGHLLEYNRPSFCRCLIVIKENKSIFPEFDWKEVYRESK